MRIFLHDGAVAYDCPRTSEKEPEFRQEQKKSCRAPNRVIGAKPGKPSKSANPLGERPWQPEEAWADPDDPGCATGSPCLGGGPEASDPGRTETLKGHAPGGRFDHRVNEKDVAIRIERTVFPDKEVSERQIADNA